MKTQTLTLQKVQITYLIKFFILLALATGAPALGFHSQWVTGPIVNAALILSVFLVGVRGALLVGMLPSTIALSTGLLPAVLAPMIPFIIIGNSVLVLTVDLLSGRDAIYRVSEDAINSVSTIRYFAALTVGAILKFLFLFITSSIVISLLIKQALAAQVAAMMSWPQLITALMGGVLAWIVLKILKK